MIDHQIKIEAAQVSLKKMLSRGYFCVIDAKQIADLLGTSFTTEQRKFLGVLHCVEFSDMPETVRAELRMILEEVYSEQAFEITVGKTLLGKPKIERLRLA